MRKKKEDKIERIMDELMVIAMGEKAYPEYDKNGEEQLQYPPLNCRMKAMEMLPKMKAQQQSETSAPKRRVVVVDDV